jgi:hypothetical protein
MQRYAFMDVKRRLLPFFYSNLAEKSIFSRKSLEVSEKRLTFASHLRHNASLLQ